MLLTKKTPAKTSAKTALRIGEVVTLKSGGRQMTAIWAGKVLFAPDNWLICQWFGDDGDLHQEMFPEDTLERAQQAFAA